MDSIEVKGPMAGTYGHIKEIELKPDTILIIQLPRATNMLSSTYIAGAMRAIREVMPSDRKVLIVGNDVNIYEMAGPEALNLILKGVLH